MKSIFNVGFTKAVVGGFIVIEQIHLIANNDQIPNHVPLPLSIRMQSIPTQYRGIWLWSESADERTRTVNFEYLSLLHPGGILEGNIMFETVQFHPCWFQKHHDRLWKASLSEDMIVSFYQVTWKRYSPCNNDRLSWSGISMGKGRRKMSAFLVNGGIVRRAFLLPNFTEIKMTVASQKASCLSACRFKWILTWQLFSKIGVGKKTQPV